jgi:sugar/nucleoside kinase (ribokinase family)
VKKPLDLIVCGSCVVDVLVRPVTLEQPIGPGTLHRTDPLVLTTGGIVPNAGITAARLGLNVAALTYVGDDPWAKIVRSQLQAEAVDTSQLLTHPNHPTSTTAVLIDHQAQRSFLHAVGAPKQLGQQTFLDRLDFFASARAMLLGYYPLLPNLLDDLPAVLAAVQRTGCLTALDAAGDGGGMSPLEECLPHLDFYFPSQNEAQHQTGESDPQKILAAYRAAGATGVVGVKLGAQGALLSPRPHQWIEIPAVEPPAPVVDTTGAGDCFWGGLLTGILNGLAPAEAGRLAAAAGALCTTALGATTALADYASTARLAGLR